MTVIADFTVPADDFALGRIMEVRRGINVKLETMVPTGESVMPYFWVPVQDADAVEATLRDDPLTLDVDTIDEVNGEVLFRVSWSSEIDGLVDAILNTGAVVLEAEGTGDDWLMELRFGDYDSLSTFYEGCTRKDIGIDLDKVHSSIGDGETDGYGLTDEQRDTLLTALEEGYFEVPRETTLVELGEVMDISDSAVSQRLRRGLSKLLAETLLDSRGR